MIHGEHIGEAKDFAMENPEVGRSGRITSLTTHETPANQSGHSRHGPHHPIPPEQGVLILGFLLHKRRKPAVVGGYEKSAAVNVCVAGAGIGSEHRVCHLEDG